MTSKTMNKTVVFAILLVAIFGTSGVLISDVHAAVFAKYDGVDGEATDAAHDKWIDILTIDWSVDTKQKKKKTKPIVGEFVITMAYEKSSPKLLEKLASGSTIPSLEIELTKTVPDPATGGEQKVTYLRYELTNVRITSYDVNASGSDLEAPPTVVVGNNFEEIKVTYTEYDDTGTAKGNVEAELKVGKGE